MADATGVHRKYLKASIGALCLEKGFNAVSRLAIETLTEMIQSYLGEIGRSSLAICELAGRSKPTLNDVRLALIEIGLDVDEIKSNTHATKKVVLRPSSGHASQSTKPLQSGTRETQPPYVPNYLPAFPDPHSYIKTLSFRKEAEEYEVCRDNYAAMRRDVEAGLARFLARTSTSEPIVKNCTDAEKYLLMLNESTAPAYLKALMPCAEDNIVRNTNNNKADKTLQEADDTEKATTESPDNPYQKPAKKFKTEPT